jgi:hypothetical protein
VHLGIRLTPAEYDELTRRAKRLGKSRGAVLRALLALHDNECSCQQRKAS